MSTETHTGREHLMRWFPLAVRGVITATVVLAVVSLGVASYGDEACARCHVQQSDTPHQSASCWACHSWGTSTDLIDRPMRVARMFTLWATSTDARFARTDSGCIGCHSDTLDGVSNAAGLRMRHDTCAVGRRCGECHVVHGDQDEQRLRLGICATCHNELGQDNSCGSCHQTAVPAITRAQGWLSRVHGPHESSHADVGATNPCALCHASDYCRECHAVRLPHGEIGEWRATHGLDARESDTECLRCHSRSECDSCHAIELPHPEGFLPQHGAEASGSRETSCLVCHSEEDCTKCHVRHAHPYGEGFGSVR